MTRFDEVTYNEASQTAVVGAGLVWDDVYAALAPHNVNAVGGRVTGIGVAGFTLGGGTFVTACRLDGIYIITWQAIHGKRISTA